MRAQTGGALASRLEGRPANGHTPRSAERGSRIADGWAVIGAVLEQLAALTILNRGVVLESEQVARVHKRL